jgi:AmpD protein
MTALRPLSIDRSGHLVGVRQVRSPNQDRRPRGQDAELVVIHGISLPPGKFGGPVIEQLFTNRLPANGRPFLEGLRGLKVSAHVLVRRTGEIVQFVPFHRRAWHAGESRFNGRERCNDFSVGVELEGTDELPYEAGQYRRLAEVIAALRRAYPGLWRAPVVGHSDVAPGRKTDPGPAFNWRRFARCLARAEQNGATAV